MLSQSEFHEKCREVSGYWQNLMGMMAMEELAELSKAISKMERSIQKGENHKDTPKLRTNVIEEMGDVLICIEALKGDYDISNQEIMEYVEHKLNKKYE